jgi:hypothetical protein
LSRHPGIERAGSGNKDVVWFLADDENHGHGLRLLVFATGTYAMPAVVATLPYDGA